MRMPDLHLNYILLEQKPDSGLDSRDRIFLRVLHKPKWQENVILF